MCDHPSRQKEVKKIIIYVGKPVFTTREKAPFILVIY